MDKKEKFFYDIDNIKTDFEMENMNITDEDIRLLERYSNDEISLNDMISSIKNSVN